MSRKKDIHFEVSERKVLLRLLDIIVVFLGIYLLTLLFGFEYLTIERDNAVSLIVLALYIS